MTYLHRLLLGLCFTLAATSVCHADDHDPWEGFNRAMFAFNDTTDRYLLKPVTLGYRKVTPQPVRQGVGNVFSNALEIRNVFNGLLQGKPGQAGKDTGRFLINTTLGVAGLFDVAQHMGLEKTDGEDFGQTLGVWGVSNGPYLVLPLLGPRTLRDTASIPVDWVTEPMSYAGHTRTTIEVRIVEAINTRSSLLAMEQDIGSDKYTLLREAYLQRREYLINDGQVEDTFGAGADDDFGEFGDF
ncbi:MAG TPA: VacJ family lipoprotein [Cellvibrionaceae bacterium]